MIDTTRKMHVIGRSDLDVGLFTAQAVHAARKLVAQHPELELAWYEQSNNVGVLVVPNEQELKELLARAEARQIPVAAFYEEDLGGQLTAIAMLDGRKVTSSLPRARREHFAATPKAA